MNWSVSQVVSQSIDTLVSWSVREFVRLSAICVVKVFEGGRALNRWHGLRISHHSGSAEVISHHSGSAEVPRMVHMRHRVHELVFTFLL